MSSESEAAESGLAACLIGSTLVLAAMVGFVFNVQLAAVGRSIMGRLDWLLHSVGTTVVLILMLALAAQGKTLADRGHGGLARAGRSLNVIAAVLWVLVAIGEAFVLGGLR